jgi:hypothetical protein
MYSVQDTLAGGFPHSEISGSKFARNSPELIAACYVLHRLLAPRHPPNALLCLISTLSVTPSAHLHELTAKYVASLASLGRTQGRSAFARSAKTPYGSSELCAEFSNQIRTDASSSRGRADRVIPKRRHTLFTMSKIEEPNTGKGRNPERTHAPGAS